MTPPLPSRPDLNLSEVNRKTALCSIRSLPEQTGQSNTLGLICLKRVNTAAQHIAEACTNSEERKERQGSCERYAQQRVTSSVLKPICVPRLHLGI